MKATTTAPAGFNEAGHFHGRKDRALLRGHGTISCFNEAGHFHGRKGRAGRTSSRSRSCFNEAGHFHGRKADTAPGPRNVSSALQ